METWLRTGALKRKANETGNANPNCDTLVVTTSKCNTIKVKEASSSKRKIHRKYDSSYLEFGFT
jgi:hypothetical protein